MSDPASLLEFAKVAGPSALGTIVVLFLVFKFIPDLLAAAEKRLESQGATFRGALDTVVAAHDRTRNEDRASLKEGLDRLEHAIVANGDQDRSHRESEGAKTRTATAELTAEVRNALRNGSAAESCVRRVEGRK